MATKYDQSSATRPVSIRSHTSAFQVHFKHTSSALEMSSVNPPNVWPDRGLDRSNSGLAGHFDRPFLDTTTLFSIQVSLNALNAR